jgi:phosphoesterase RecJ-like protein
LRSKGNFKVNEIAKKYFSGGGHKNAAGGISDISVNDTIEKLKEIFNEYKTQLLNTKL